MKTKRSIFASAFVFIVTILISQRVPASQIENLPVEQLPMMFNEAVDLNNVTNVIQYLKRAPGLVNQKLGWDTPLMSVTRFERSEMVELLLNNGADPNCIDGLSRTPLYYSCHSIFYSGVKLLIENGANVNLADKNNTFR